MAEEGTEQEDEHYEPSYQWATNPNEVEFDYDEMGGEEMEAQHMEGEQYEPYKALWEERGC